MNSENIIELNKKRFISQITHFTCAKCGGDNKISNRDILPFNIIDLTNDLIQINFTCEKCSENYDLGICKK